MFYSYYNSDKNKADVESNILGEMILATMRTYAANNHIWISSTNNSRPFSYGPGFFINPDGSIAGKLTNNKAGVLISTVDTSVEFYDASEYWRDRSIDGIFHSGTLVQDKRSDCRTDL